VNFIKISEHYKYVNSKDVHNIMDGLRFLNNLRKNIEEFNENDVIIMNTIPYFGYGRILRKIKTKKISIFHEAWYDYLNEYNFFFRHMLRREISNIVKASNLIIARSNPTSKSLVNNYGALNVRIIPDGIDLEMIDSVHKYSNEFDIVYLGRLAAIKHVDHLIKAVNLVKEQIPSIKVGIVGHGENLEDLKKLVNNLNLQNNVIFLGRVNELDKYRILKSSKIFVLPSEREGFSISTLEAMSCGAVPIVAKPKYDEVFGTSDFVEDEQTGLYYNYGNIIALKEKLIKLLTDENLYNFLKINGKLKARNYDWNKIVDEYDKAISSLL
ncbi:MAG: glycosyltransferase family 4 protein, partial [Caldisphaera sp.]